MATINYHLYNADCLDFMRSDVFTGQSAICFAWFVWVKGYKGKPTVDWIV